MSETARDLWPEDIKVDSLSPAMILNEQAEALAKKTQGLIQPELLVDDLEKITVLHLDLVAPSVNNVRQRILTVHHFLERPYPAVLIASAFQEEDLEDFDVPVKPGDWFISDEDVEFSPMAYGPDLFLQLIEIVFTSKDVRSWIMSVLARANEAKGSPLTRVRIRTEDANRQQSAPVESGAT